MPAYKGRAGRTGHTIQKNLPGHHDRTGSKVCYNNRFATLACRIFTLVGTGGPAPWRWPFPDR